MLCDSKPEGWDVLKSLKDPVYSKWALGLGSFDQIDALMGGLFENG